MATAGARWWPRPRPWRQLPRRQQQPHPTRTRAAGTPPALQRTAAVSQLVQGLQGPKPCAAAAAPDSAAHSTSLTRSREPAAEGSCSFSDHRGLPEPVQRPGAHPSLIVRTGKPAARDYQVLRAQAVSGSGLRAQHSRRHIFGRNRPKPDTKGSEVISTSTSPIGASAPASLLIGPRHTCASEAMQPFAASSMTRARLHLAPQRAAALPLQPRLPPPPMRPLGRGSRLQVVAAVKKAGVKNVVCSKTLVIKPGHEEEVAKLCEDIVQARRGCKGGRAA